MQTKASSPPRPAGVGSDERLPMLPKVLVPLKANLQDTPMQKSFAESLLESANKWFPKKPTTSNDIPTPEPSHTMMPRMVDLRKQCSAPQVLVGLNPSELPMLDTTHDLCPRCHGFLKHEVIPSLPHDWTECKLNSGRIGFFNPTTNETLAIPPPGMPPTSCVVFQYHGTTSHVCRCRQRRSSLISPSRSRKSRRYSTSALIVSVAADHSNLLPIENTSTTPNDAPPMVRQSSNLK
ncbi:hypothetical protein SPRG_19695 [Saprolegnia parasitica CBS 223.65]|uniref:WW domain-containing protein n=1 Tax=Saprolegnia parasitica (strain CBS 223.65) TaxID=695850 RepID=A0A067CTD8_SAPPC|nr:hypothetical protein SPRG_19695 [Saprolegnia parasitica CBS 223.65]KDO29791.1 hypothetical protein SPRG_19695 [Saprolegnia parasitica CBS 223.65]|eukprot:XP_012199519.1 hypothetical protein SPRG_19695 [Saprolegnia parasitica CBS 223.65]